MRVTADNLLIKPMPWPEQKHGTILLPDSRESKAQLGRGEIIAMGAGAYTQQGAQLPPDMSVGEYVYYLKRSRVPVIVDGWEMDLVPEREILMVLTKNEITEDKTAKEGETSDG